MKKHITVEQFDELGNKQRQLLRDWWRPQPGDHAYFEGMYKVMIEADSPFVGTSGVKYYPILSIGQMIEFLMETNSYIQDSYIDDSYKNTIAGSDYGVLGIGWDGELCDALWKAVKEELEKE